MDKTELISKIKEIGTCEDDVTRRDLLTSLSEACEQDYDELEQLKQNNQTLTNDNESLRAANMKLFLKVGESKTKEEIIQNQTGINQDPPVKRRSLTEIFNS